MHLFALAPLATAGTPTSPSLQSFLHPFARFHAQIHPLFNYAADKTLLSSMTQVNLHKQPPNTYLCLLGAPVDVVGVPGILFRRNKRIKFNLFAGAANYWRFDGDFQDSIGSAELVFQSGQSDPLFVPGIKHKVNNQLASFIVVYWVLFLGYSTWNGGKCVFADSERRIGECRFLWRLHNFVFPELPAFRRSRNCPHDHQVRVSNTKFIYLRINRRDCGSAEAFWEIKIQPEIGSITFEMANEGGESFLSLSTKYITSSGSVRIDFIPFLLFYS